MVIGSNLRDRAVPLKERESERPAAPRELCARDGVGKKEEGEWRGQAVEAGRGHWAKAFEVGGEEVTVVTGPGRRRNGAGDG